jgi:hypothetical protein
MAISSRLLHRLRQLIADAHSAFVINYISTGAVPPDVLERLRRLGMVRPRKKAVDQAYFLGRLIAAKQAEQDRVAAAAKLDEDKKTRSGTKPTLRVGSKPGPGTSTPVLKDADSKQVGLEALEEVLRRNPIPLTNVERRALDVDAVKTGQYIVGLGNRIEQKTGNMLIEVDRKLDNAYRNTVKDAVARNIELRESVGKLRSDLGHASGDWSRDLARIAFQEKQNALQSGYVAEVAKVGGDDARMFRLVAPTACVDCKRLYIGENGNPRIFTVNEVQANGSNYGRKRQAWLPVMEATHINCSCSWSRLPDGARPLASGRFSYEDAEKALRQPPMRPALRLRKSVLPKTRP